MTTTMTDDDVLAEFRAALSAVRDVEDAVYGAAPRDAALKDKTPEKPPENMPDTAAQITPIKSK